jgi:hypothetical protein
MENSEERLSPSEKRTCSTSWRGNATPTSSTGWLSSASSAWAWRRCGGRHRHHPGRPAPLAAPAILSEAFCYSGREHGRRCRSEPVSVLAEVVADRAVVRRELSPSGRSAAARSSPNAIAFDTVVG